MSGYQGLPRAMFFNPIRGKDDGSRVVGPAEKLFPGALVIATKNGKYDTPVVISNIKRSYLAENGNYRSCTLNVCTYKVAGETKGGKIHPRWIEQFKEKHIDGIETVDLESPYSFAAALAAS